MCMAQANNNNRKSTGYQFLFNDCPRGSAATSHRRKGKHLLCECRAMCDADASCNAIEVNGCGGNTAQCGGECVHFYGRGTDFSNGNCRRNGDQKAYKKVCKLSTNCIDGVASTTNWYLTHHPRACATARDNAVRDNAGPNSNHKRCLLGTGTSFKGNPNYERCETRIIAQAVKKGFVYCDL